MISALQEATVPLWLVLLAFGLGVMLDLAWKVCSQHDRDAAAGRRRRG